MVMVTPTFKLCVGSFIVLIVLCEYVTCQRGRAGARHRFVFEEPDIVEEKKTKETQIRIARGKFNKFKVDSSHDVLLKTTTTTTTTVTTKSPEQILKEWEAERETRDPKHVGRKFKRILEQVEKDAEEMTKKLHEKLDNCMNNKDCGNSTCCYKENDEKPGKCIVKPHKIDQQCSDLCGCVGTELECKLMEIDQQKDDSNVKATRQCKKRVLTENHYLEEIFNKFKKGKAGLEKPKTRRVRTHRILFD